MKVAVNLLKYEVGYVTRDKQVKKENFYKQGKKIRSLAEAQRRFMKPGEHLLAYKCLGRIEYNFDVKKESIQ